MSTRRLNGAFLGFLLSASMVGAAQTSAIAAPTLRVGDHVAVQVFNHPELSGDRVINSDGTITVPLAGSIAASGSDPQAIAARIRGALKTYLPYVAVEVQRTSEGSPITVAGWPYPISDGVVKYLPHQTLAGAIASMRVDASRTGNGTGTFDPYHSRIDMRSVIVERDGRRLGTYDMVAMTAAGNPGPTLLPGYAIRFVNKPVALSVSGAVKEPGYAYLAVDEPLSNAIEQVGGFRDNAKTAGMLVRRDGQQHTLSIGDPAFHQPANGDDALDVPAAPQVVVAGIVLHPGTVMLKTDTSLVAAVFNAGGPDKDSDLGNVRVIRNGTVKNYDVTAITRGDISQNPDLRDGDEVYVPRGRRGADVGVFASILSSLGWAFFRN